MDEEWEEGNSTLVGSGTMWDVKNEVGMGVGQEEITLFVSNFSTAQSCAKGRFACK